MLGSKIRRFRWAGARYALVATCLIGGLESPLLAQKDVQFSIRSGEIQDLEVRLGADSRRDLNFRAELLPLGSSRWPEGDALSFGFIDQETTEDEAPLAEAQVVPFMPGGRRLLLRVAARPCCAAGTYSRTIEVSAVKRATGEATGADKLVIVVKLTVEPGVNCPLIITRACLFALLSVLLVGYARNMYAHSRFISAEALAGLLKPQLWASWGESRDFEGTGRVVCSKISEQLRIRDRLWAWLKANPLVFALPGQCYEETLQLDLRRNIEGLRLRLDPQRNAAEHYRRNPTEAKGNLYAKANRAGVSLFGRPDEEGRISHLEVQPPIPPGRVSDIPPRTKFLDPKSKEKDEPAGWRIARSQ